MNKLIKGNLVMTNVANKDVDMYIKCGWKLETKQNKFKKKKESVLNKEILQDSNVEDSIECNIVKE